MDIPCCIIRLFGVEGSTLVEELKDLALNGEQKEIVERLMQEAKGREEDRD